MNKVIKVFSACTLLVFLAGGNAPAKTPDGVTPAEETVCDDLRDAAPGLYGLCVAFCEAQDCEVEWSGEDPSFAGCSPSSQKLFENYERKRGPDGPEMPCAIKPVVTTGGVGGGCPCYSQEDLSTYFLSPYTMCLVDYNSTNTTMIRSGTASASTMFTNPNYSCNYNFGTGLTQLTIDQSEFEGCRDLLVGMINAGTCDVEF